MNMQTRSEKRSLALHREIVRKLRNNPVLWRVPEENLLKWKAKSDHLSPALQEWEHILKTQSHEQILDILESTDEDAVRLRSSSPFTGILSHDERSTIFASFRTHEDIQSGV